MDLKLKLDTQAVINLLDLFRNDELGFHESSPSYKLSSKGLSSLDVQVDISAIVSITCSQFADGRFVAMFIP